jgi:hypothetical protein
MSEQIANHQAMCARSGGPPPRQQILVVSSRTGQVNFVRGDQFQNPSAKASGIQSDCQEQDEEKVENAVTGRKGRNKKKREKKKPKRIGQNSAKTLETNPAEYITQHVGNQADIKTSSAVWHHMLQVQLLQLVLHSSHSSQRLRSHPEGSELHNVHSNMNLQT